MGKLTATIIGATGEVGRSFAECLSRHPYFEVNMVYASERSAGKRYGDIVKGRKIDDGILDLTVGKVSEMNAGDSDIYFCALPGSEAKEVEGIVAKYRPVFSTTSAHRYDPDVPIIVPGANEEHCQLLLDQKKNRGWEGFICPQSNCTTVGGVIPAKALQYKFGIKLILMATQQAVSGAGHDFEEEWHRQRIQQGTDLPEAIDFTKKPDFPATVKFPLIEGNLVPNIKGEEGKIRKETKKILGKYKNGGIIDANIEVGPATSRVGVKDGHSLDMFLFLEKPFTIEEVIDAWAKYKPDYKNYRLPSAPSFPILYLNDDFSPQPRFDITREDGMAVILGRARTYVEGVLQFKSLSHNTKICKPKK